MLNADLTKKAEHYKHNSLLSSIKKGKEVVMFGDIEIEKKKKNYRNNPANIYLDEDILKTF